MTSRALAGSADAQGSAEADVAAQVEGGEGPTPYEVLLADALAGDSRRFTRQDAVMEQWRIVQPLLDRHPPVIGYAPGSWGPPQADALAAHAGGWHAPWLPA